MIRRCLDLRFRPMAGDFRLLNGGLKRKRTGSTGRPVRRDPGCHVVTPSREQGCRASGAHPCGVRVLRLSISGPTG